MGRTCDTEWGQPTDKQCVKKRKDAVREDLEKMGDSDTGPTGMEASNKRGKDSRRVVTPRQ